MKYLFIIVLFVSMGSAASSQQETIALFVNDLVEIQKRNFEPSVNHCHDLEPKASKKIKSQYNDYIAFYQKSMFDIWIGFANNKEYENEVGGQLGGYEADPEMMAMQSKQGATFLEMTREKPDVYCSRLSQMMGGTSKQDLMTQIEDGLLDYRKRRAEFCATIPTPENCK